MGTLIMQKPPDPIHTGCGQDTVGPGSYSPSLIPPARKAVAWGKDKRGFKYATEVPGPGAYNPAKPSMRSHNNPVVVVVNGMEVQFGGAHGTSQFASKVGAKKKYGAFFSSLLVFIQWYSLLVLNICSLTTCPQVPLFSQRTPSDHIKTPGPGAYVEGAGLASKAVPLPPDLQFFGSGAKRYELSSHRNSIVELPHKYAMYTTFIASSPMSQAMRNRPHEIALRSIVLPQSWPGGVR